MKTKMPKVTKATKYYDKDRREYVFPFEVFDKTPGGSNLGRIEWWIEPVWKYDRSRKRYCIDEAYVWARQTRDKRYAGKLFLVDCFGDNWFSSCTHIHDNFIKYVWLIEKCMIHKTMQYGAYPEDHHTKLVISENGFNVYFED